MLCDNMTNYFMIGIIGILFFGLIIILITVILHYSHQKRIEELTRYSINLSTAIDDTIPVVLESFIQNCLDDLLIITGGTINESYISEADEKALRDQLVTWVVKRISPNMIDKLSAYYSKVNISSIISDKIYIVITNYVVGHNAMFMNPSEEKK